MYLKRIVLHGFKSFADRTEFDFGPGMTMIVGPNGCGKSNVLDAVRWVLGEQSARSLRGRKMSDVVFAGSRSRKPANAASVELTFDNRSHFLGADANEVVVGRILYRSGDSEYRLNGEGCRLKDIRRLFLDTGVGVDAYSIIEQGRVDLLLQANPLERREIFEEAAGISRYKVQRAEAQSKLERTQNNLLRLNDVVDELERRLRSVKLAATKARKWQEYDARIRELRASFSLAEYHQLECARRETLARHTTLDEQLQQQRVELGACDAEAAEHEHAVQQFEEQIQAAEARLTALQSEHSALAERIAQGERRVADLTAARQRRQAQVAELGEREGQLDQRIQVETQALQVLIEAAERSAARIHELQQAHNTALQQRDAGRRALEAAKTAVFEAVRRAALLHSEQNSLAAQHGRLEAQAQRLAARRQELDAEIAQLAAQRDTAAEHVAALDRRSAELSGELKQADTQVVQGEAACREIEQALAAAKEARSAVISRLELLEDLERRLDGIDQGTLAVLEWRNEPSAPGGVLGLVADLLRIDDPRVWVLQPVLATFENHVVVADTYAFLSELGRRPELSGPVQLIALDRLPAEPIRLTYDGSPGFVARATDWVSCAPECKPLAEHLLGRVVIVDVIERALAIAANAPEGYVFVTLDGRTVSSSGRLTVGVARAQPGLISRKSEIRQLHERLAEVEHQIQHNTQARLVAEQTLSDAQLRRSALLNRIATVQKEHAEARPGLQRLEGELGRAQRELAVGESEVQTVRRGLHELEQQAEKLQAETVEAGAAQRTHEGQITALESVLVEFETAVGRAAQELTGAMVQAGRDAEKKTAGEEALTQLETARAALQRERAAAGFEAEEAAAQIAATQAEVQAAQQRQVACSAEVAQCQTDVLHLREGRQEIRLRLESCGARTRAVQERMRQLETELHELNVSQRELDVRQEGLVARIRDELALDLAEQYRGYQPAEQDLDAVRTEIEALRDKLARLGNVNLDALAELEELTPRYDNLVAQRTDLVTSIERLQTLIAELDQESRTRFAATFEQIRANFQDLFRKLFNGGKADIILEDPERPLECGIEIMARPPGKEPQSISLLSGGEKTMTAVALLMAVFKSKPSPFCFLDEVDAALDEPNTERFNTLLQEFLVHSQFVVITHSKRTMQCGDVLYGVTMEEPGVSKRVSVRFDDRVQTPNVA